MILLARPRGMIASLLSPGAALMTGPITVDSSAAGPPSRRHDDKSPLGIHRTTAGLVPLRVGQRVLASASAGD